MENINIGSLDLSHLKTELHNNTGEQSDAHISKSRVGEKIIEAHFHEEKRESIQTYTKCMCSAPQSKQTNLL